MLWDFPWSVPWGGHDSFISVPSVETIPGGAKTTFEPVLVYSQYYTAVIDGTQNPVPTYCAVAVPQTFQGLFLPTTNKHAISIAPLGDWGTGTIDATPQQVFFEALRGNRLNVLTSGTPQYIAYVRDVNTITQLTNWDLQNVSRFTNTRPVSGRPTYAQLDLTITNSGSTRTVTLLLDGVIQATGFRTGDGTITLSGNISGTVDITYTGDVPNGTLDVDFPEAYNIYYGMTPFTGGTFPTTPNGSVQDNGQDDTYTFVSPVVAAGVWYITVRQVDSEGKESTNIDNLPVTSYTPPNPPGTPFYAAGGALNTNVKALASTTAGATYLLYDSLDQGAITLQTDDVSQTLPAASGLMNIVLAPIDPAFTGERAILLHSVYSGVESANIDVYTIEYVNGVVQLPRPNSPTAGKHITVTGRTLAVNYNYSVIGQATSPATFEIFIYAIGTTPNYASPQGTASASTKYGASITGTISGTVASNGLYNFQIRAKSALNQQDLGTFEYGPLQLSNATPAAPNTTSVSVGF